MPISKDEALQYVDPSLSGDSPGPGVPSPRDQAAQRLQEGVLANEIYWSHRSDLDALRAKAEGHGQLSNPDLIRGHDEQVAAPESKTDTIEGTATEEPATEITAPAPVPSPDNPNDAIAKLRQQLRDRGVEPEA